MAEQQRLACNRKPFETDSSCDRGDVDTELFIDFPLCDPIEPTPSDAAPITIDFPVVPFSPPPCACVAVEFSGGGQIEDRKDIYLDINFEAMGDCCEGNYKTDVDIRIPCIPFEVDEEWKERDIAITNNHCDDPEGTFAIRMIKENCSLSIEPKIELKLPCIGFDIHEESSTVTIEQEDCDVEPHGEFSLGIERKCDDCEITFNPKLDIVIPKPPEYSFGSNQVNIGYNCGESTGTITLKEEGDECEKEITPELDLSLKCIPFDIESKDTVVDITTICSEDGSGEASGTFSLNVQADCCSIAFEPQLALDIPMTPAVELVDGTVNITQACDYKGTLKFNETRTVSARGACKKTYTPELDLKIKCIPFDITNNTKNHPVVLKRGNGKATLSTNVTANCCMLTVDPALNIEVPCALDGLEMISETGRLEIKVETPWQECKSKFKFKIKGLTTTVNFLTGIRFTGHSFEPIIGTMEFEDGILVCATGAPVTVDMPVVGHENKCCGGDGAPEEGDDIETGDTQRGWPWLY